MTTNSKWGAVVLGVLLTYSYNAAQPDLIKMRTNQKFRPGTHKREAYGPSMTWLDRLSRGESGSPNPMFKNETKLNFSVLSSMMIAGLASGFRSQVANLLWMKSDEYWHEGLLTRQIPLMEAVVTLDPQFIDAWSTAGWHYAYNIYADRPTEPQFKNNPIACRRMQMHDIAAGVDYLDRGSNANPDTYRLWFEDGWTRSEKGGDMGDTTVALFRESRRKPDARLLEKTVAENGKAKTKEVQGADLVGRTIGHIYEKRPDIGKALNEYSIMLMHGEYEAKTGKTANPDSRTPLPKDQEQLLHDAGVYWSEYGYDCDKQIVSIYKDGDPVVKSKIKALIPDIDHMVEAIATRTTMEGYDSQPTGAYISIVARYLPAWTLYKKGDIDGAIATIIGVMNADPRYHLKKLGVTAKIFAIRGDGPLVIDAEVKAAKDFERSSSQEIGLHFLAKLYEAKAAKAIAPAQKRAALYLAYTTWYRARLRNSLDYQALFSTYKMEDDDGFKPPKGIEAAIKKSREKGNDVNAAPAAPPNVSQYQSAPDA